MYELAAQFGISRDTVAQRLREAGTTMRRRSPTEAQIDEMVRLYATGLSLAGVGERLGFDTSTVHRYVRAREVHTRDTHGR